MKKYLAINKCPVHKFLSLAIEDEDGCGTRITPSKCCGQWKTVRRWEITSDMMYYMVDALVDGDKDIDNSRENDGAGNGIDELQNMFRITESKER